MTIKRKRFAMSNPYGAWGDEFRITADPDIIDYLEALDYIIDLHHIIQGYTAMVQLNPLYDFEEAWLTIYDELEDYCNRVELDAVWGLPEDEQP